MIKAIVTKTMKFSGMGVIPSGSVFKAKTKKELPVEIFKEIEAGTGLIKVIEEKEATPVKKKPPAQKKAEPKQEEVEENTVEEKKEEKPSTTRTRRKRTK